MTEPREGVLVNASSLFVFLLCFVLRFESKTGHMPVCQRQCKIWDTGLKGKKFGEWENS